MYNLNGSKSSNNYLFFAKVVLEIIGGDVLRLIEGWAYLQMAAFHLDTQ